ncbi:MAG: acetate/propionate family kinase [Terracidiphilus sp.]|jgi:acetate kinase
MKCLIPNIGSTSFKFRVLDTPDGTVLAEGRVERIGQPGGECPDYPAAIAKCLAAVAGEGKALRSLSEIEAVGFKVVHGGPISEPRIIDEELLAVMEEFSFIAPAHNPPYIAAIKAFRQVLPGVPLVAVIETYPYRFLSEATNTYAVPYEWSRDFGMHRYGFHGATHRSASERTQALLGRQNLRHICCHLGGSSSVAAFRDGVAIGTSMGASPQSGLPQNNRVGDVDVFAVLHMMKKLKLDPDQMAVELSSRSGLAGISGSCGDIRDLSQGAAKGDKRCQLALDVYVRAIRHYVGALMLELGGIDVITFSGGIGENSAEIRSAVLKNLAGFGVEIDEDRNRTIKGEGTISTKSSPVKVLVVPANEEMIVARDTVTVVEEAGKGMVVSHAGTAAV